MIGKRYPSDVTGDGPPGRKRVPVPSVVSPPTSSDIHDVIPDLYDSSDDTDDTDLDDVSVTKKSSSHSGSSSSCLSK